MDNQSTRNNHYVPDWYQRGFLKPGHSKLYRLDMAPDVISLPDGRLKARDVLHHWSPKRCFVERDLYTTFFGPVINDEIEKYLFGNIDDRGAKAVRAFSLGDLAAIHHSFGDFFEFLDAQKLRTPKGLDWISSRYGSLDQVQLMREMQGLRFMHCTMWTEAVREIVSAEDSDVKFIVSDHPVTVYNQACDPSALSCAYPDEPTVDLIGTQTVFVLDASTCLILTNLEYTEEPLTKKLYDRRTHARFGAGGLVRTDAFIRTRKLTRNEVISVNHLLKSRARRFVAAAEKEWLYPEQHFPGHWRDIAQVLRPKNELYKFGGELFVGNTDGTTHYQDQFGRTSRAHEYLSRRKIPTNLGVNDNCGCGSGKKFKHCCADFPEEMRPTWKVYGLRERNLLFSRRVQSILETDKKTWDDIRRDLNDDHVVRIHEAFASLWPGDTDLADLLPRPNHRVFRATYLGAPNVRTIEMAILGWLTYFDEIVLAHPFINPDFVKPDFSPTKSPRQHREQTLKNVFLLLLLEPFIRNGLIHLVPCPGDFNPQLGRTMMKMADERVGNWKAGNDDTSQFRQLMEIEHERFLGRMPNSELRGYLKREDSDAPAEVIEQLIARLKAGLAADPFALMQPIQLDQENGHLQITKGFALEAALYLAALTGSAVYTDLGVHWQQLHQHTSAGFSSEDKSPTLEDWKDLDLPMEGDVREIILSRNAGKHGELRAALRKTLATVQGERGHAMESVLAEQLKIFTKSISKLASTTPAGLSVMGRMMISAPAEGFERHDVRRLLLTYGRAGNIGRVPMTIRVSTRALRR